jgi:chemotaxis methyl-accepting protein methylase
LSSSASSRLRGEIPFEAFLRETLPLLGFDPRPLRRRGIRRAIARRMGALRIQDFARYRDLALSYPSEAAALAGLLRVTVSRFFRNGPLWGRLAELVLPDLLARFPDACPLRAWSAGCASGEEPFSLAILWLGRMAPRFPGRRLEIVATDVDDACLARAAVARYAPGTLREVAADLRRFLAPIDPRLFEVAAEARSLVCFRRADLLADPPPPACHLILCRNLAFTYFVASRLAAALDRLAAALVPGGILLVGRTEVARDPRFAPVADLPSTYRRQGC